MKSISLVWTIDDVQSIREDLSDDQAGTVLDTCLAEHDASIGVNWDVIEAVAQRLFPEVESKD